MGKYEPLAEFLSKRIPDEWDASFRDVEEVLSSKLPPSARRHDSWWGNATRGNSSQAKGWIAAGWVTVPGEVDRNNEKVRFVRAQRAGRRDSIRNLNELRETAMRYTGITSIEELERSALELLIRREAGRRLIALGGSMPDAEAPPRRRFD